MNYKSDFNNSKCYCKQRKAHVDKTVIIRCKVIDFNDKLQFIF